MPLRLERQLENTTEIEGTGGGGRMLPNRLDHLLFGPSVRLHDSRTEICDTWQAGAAVV